MHVLVVLAGVADPRKPLAAPASGDWRDAMSGASVGFKLSPFDEAALETALKLRHAGTATRITAVVTDGANDINLMRAVAALKPDEVCGAPGMEALRWDPLARARALARTLDRFADAQLVLIGREHGDTDDGSLPGMLADVMGHDYVGLALSVTGAEAGICVERLAGESTASARLGLPAVVSMTNDKSNRLRHPLLKNVMQAKQQKFDALDGNAGEASQVQASWVRPAASRRNSDEPCRMLQGSLPEQARQLAEFLTALVPTEMTTQTPARVVALIALDADDAADAHALMAASRELAQEIGARTAVVMVGSRAEPQLASSLAGAADDAWLTAVPELAVPSQAQQLVPVFAHALQEALGPELGNALILMRSSVLNDEVAARLGVRLDAAVLGRCTRLARDAEGGGMLAYRDVCGGRLQAALAWQGPALAVLRVARQAAAAASDTAAPTPLSFAAPLPAAVSFTETSQGQRPAGFVGAQVIVSGGRGIGGEAGVAALHELASHLNAPVGGSLPAVDAGWFPISHQIGQSGSYVSPAVYLAVGVSGTPQHLAGVDPATAIVAINRDPEAPIFGVAKIGVVAEWAEFLPYLTQELQRTSTATTA